MTAGVSQPLQAKDVHEGINRKQLFVAGSSLTCRLTLIASSVYHELKPPLDSLPLPPMMLFDTLIEQRSPQRRFVSSFDIYLLIGASACFGGAVVGLASILRGRHVNTLARDVQKEMRSILSSHTAQQARVGHEFRSGLQKDLVAAQAGRTSHVAESSELSGAATGVGIDIQAPTLSSVRVPAWAAEEESAPITSAAPPIVPEIIDRLRSLEQKMDNVISPKVENVVCDVYHMLDEIRADVEKIQEETESNPGDNAELIEVILRDVLEERDVKDRHTEDAERVQIALTSLGKVVREQHMTGSTSIQSIHNQLNILKDSVAGIESRLGSLAHQLEEPKDNVGNIFPQPSRISDLFHDLLSPLVSSEPNDNVDKDISQKKNKKKKGKTWRSGYTSTVSGQPKNGTDSEEPVLVYSDGSLDSVVEAADQYARRLPKDDFKPCPAETPDAEHWSTIPDSKEFTVEDVDMLAAHAAENEAKETASTPPWKGTFATFEDLVSQKPTTPDPATEAEAEEVAACMDGPVKRYGMVGENDTETVYKE